MQRLLALAALGLVAACASDARHEAGASDAGSSSGSTPTNQDAGATPCSGDACARLKLGFTKVFIGDTDRGDNPLAYAWEYFGEDFDQIRSNYVLAGECLPRADLPQYAAVDGNDGIDNVWGAQVMRLLEPWDPTPSKAGTAALGSGRRPVIMLGEVSGGLTGAKLHAYFTYIRDGKLEPTIATWDAATLENGSFDSGPAPALTHVSFVVGTQPIDLPVQRLRVRFDLTRDGTAIGGQLSGAIAIGDMENYVTDHIWRSAPAECGGTKVVSVRKNIETMADVLLDARHDPKARCDGISFGVGFEAQGVAVTETGSPLPALPSVCQ